MSAAEERVINPFGNAPIVAAPTGASAAAVVQREVAEIQAAMVIAKKFPRDPIAAMDRILNACARPSLAEEATYSFSRGGQEVAGPSIRLAEQLARDWGNIQSGVVELTRANGVSEVMSYAWDLETNFKDEKRFQVKHWRDTKGGGYAVKEERDIYEIVANVAARRKRACILAVIPGDVQEAAVRQCEVTLKTSVEITPEKIKALAESFAAYAISVEMIEKKIQRRLEAILPAQVVQLRRIFQSLKDGMGVAGDYFELPESVGSGTTSATQTESVKEKIRGKQTAKADAKPAAGGDNIPHFDTASALKSLNDAADTGDIATLEKARTDIWLDHEQTNRQVHPDIEDAYKAHKAKLTKL